MKYCPNCGRPAEDTAKFCGGCGSPFPAPVQPVPVQPVYVAPTPVEPTYVTPAVAPAPVEPAPVAPPVAPEFLGETVVLQDPVTPAVPEPIAPATPEPQPSPEAVPVWQAPEEVPSYAAPAEPPSEPVPSAVPIAVPGYVSPQPTPVDFGTQPPAQPKKKRKLWLWILIAVLGLALIGAALFYFLYWNAPGNRILRAWEKSEASFEEITGNAPALMGALDNLGGLMDEGKYTSDTSFQYYAEDDASIFLDCRNNIDRDAKLTDGYVTADISSLEQDILLELRYSGNEEDLLLQIPDLLSDTYSIPLKSFGDEFANSPLINSLGIDASSLSGAQINLFPERITWEKLKEANQDSYDQFVDSLKFEKLDKIELTDSYGEPRTITPYQISCDTALLETFLKGCLEYYVNNAVTLSLDIDDDFVLSEIYDSISNVVLGIDDRGYLAYLAFDVEGEYIEIRIVGSENPWNCIEICTDGEKEAIVVFESAPDGFDISFYDTYSQVFEISVDDVAGDITFAPYYDADGLALDNSIRLSYWCYEDKTEFSLHYDENPSLYAEVSLTVCPLMEAPVMLDDEGRNLLSMTEMDYAFLLLEIAENVKDNPNYAWLNDLMAVKDLEGTWVCEYDVTEEWMESLQNEAGIPVELDLTEPAMVEITLRFEEDNQFEVNLDAEGLSGALEQIMAYVVEYTIELTYQEAEANGMSREEFDAAFMESSGMTISEYVQNTINEMDLGKLDTSMFNNASGSYNVKDGTIEFYEGWDETADTICLFTIEDDELALTDIDTWEALTFTRK